MALQLQPPSMRNASSGSGMVQKSDGMFVGEVLGVRRRRRMVSVGVTSYIIMSAVSTKPTGVLEVRLSHVTGRWQTMLFSAVGYGTGLN